MDSPFLLTKIVVPPPAGQALDRPDLSERLNELLRPGLRLALISAPAGYGKTTLVSEWIHRQQALNAGVRFAWLGLEPADDDALQFYTYAIRAIRQVCPDFGQKALALAENQQAFEPGLAASLLAAELNEISHPLVLVLDDYHAIHQADIHSGLATWLDHIPAHIHLVLITRSDPALPLHRYRARGQMIEFRQGDLRFDHEEITRFMCSRAQTDLTPAELDLLDERIEGWPAGLQMAAIRLHDAGNHQPVLDAIAGNKRFILDYLAEEVFNTQPAQVQQFLLATALLDRFCPDLVDALQLSADDSRAIIDQLEQSNLFIVALDREGEWYRYHHLFRDLLLLKRKQKHIQLEADAESIHNRAADWYLAHDWLEQAIQAYILAGQFERAAGLVEQHTIQLFAEGKLHALRSWIRLLPADLAERRPWLCLYRAWAAVFAGQNDETRRALEQLSTAGGAAVSNPKEKEALGYERRAVEAMLAITSGNITAAFALTEGIEPAGEPARMFAHSVLVWSKGYALRMTGQVLPAVEQFRQVVEIGLQSGNDWTILSGSVDYGQVLRMTGQLERAEEVFRSGLARVQQSKRGQGFIGRLESFLAAVLYEKNQLQEAYQLARAGVEHNRSWENPNHLVYGQWVLARIQAALGNWSEADRSIQEAERLCEGAVVIPSLRASVAANRLRMKPAQEYGPAAEAWLAGHPHQEGAMGEVEFIEGATRARIYLGSGRTDEAADLLRGMQASIGESGQTSWLIEIENLLALASPGEAAAMDHLRVSLSSGIPRGYRRIYLDEGPALIEKIARLLAMGGLPEDVEKEVGRMLGEIPQAAGTAAKGEAVLTARELEILAQVARGLSNPEIGKVLFISAGTVKAHTASIFRKLDAANRAEAVSRAKDLGLV